MFPSLYNIEEDLSAMQLAQKLSDPKRMNKTKTQTNALQYKKSWFLGL